MSIARGCLRGSIKWSEWKSQVSCNYSKCIEWLAVQLCKCDSWGQGSKERAVLSCAQKQKAVAVQCKTWCCHKSLGWWLIMAKRIQCFSGFLTAAQLLCGIPPDKTNPLSVRLDTVLYNDHQPSRNLDWTSCKDMTPWPLPLWLMYTGKLAYNEGCGILANKEQPTLSPNRSLNLDKWYYQ